MPDELPRGPHIHLETSEGEIPERHRNERRQFLRKLQPRDISQPSPKAIVAAVVIGLALGLGGVVVNESARDRQLQQDLLFHTSPVRSADSRHVSLTAPELAGITVTRIGTDITFIPPDPEKELDPTLSDREDIFPSDDSTLTYQSSQPLSPGQLARAIVADLTGELFPNKGCELVSAPYEHPYNRDEFVMSEFPEADTDPRLNASLDTTADPAHPLSQLDKEALAQALEIVLKHSWSKGPQTTYTVSLSLVNQAGRIVANLQNGTRYFVIRTISDVNHQNSNPEQ